MLLIITIFCGFLCTAWSQDDRIIVNVPPAIVLEFRKQAQSCGEQYGVDPSALRKILNWTLPNDTPHKRFLLCIFVNSGYHHEDGHFIVEKALEINPVNGTKENLRQIFEGCNKITLENNLETMYEMTACFHKHLIPKLEITNSS